MVIPSHAERVRSAWPLAADAGLARLAGAVAVRREVPLPSPAPVLFGRSSLCSEAWLFVLVPDLLPVSCRTLPFCSFLA